MYGVFQPNKKKKKRKKKKKKKKGGKRGNTNLTLHGLFMVALIAGVVTETLENWVPGVSAIVIDRN